MKMLTSCKLRFTRFFSVAAIALGFTMSVNSYAENLYYRYVNEQGVKVMNHYIPPKYAQKGYEVINASGQVIKVVPAAPTEEELAKNAAKREIKERYDHLKRRYTSVDDIEAAKQRRLSNIDTNITILKSNISTLKTKIEGVMSKAAGFERQGKEVPKKILKNLSGIRAELAVAEQLLKNRTTEYQEVTDKFDEEIADFTKGQALEETSKTKIQ